MHRGHKNWFAYKTDLKSSQLKTCGCLLGELAGSTT
ncbi:hypothetical protein N483_03105 [Pseudoalteromonas luteoviolacea NCIMB 1944]|nr:hypothetical protein N483_03105 [Pseudoalteromonas luteoviolacea NCIMB 1944]